MLAGMLFRSMSQVFMLTSMICMQLEVTVALGARVEVPQVVDRAVDLEVLAALEIQEAVPAVHSHRHHRNKGSAVAHQEVQWHPLAVSAVQHQAHPLLDRPLAALIQEQVHKRPPLQTPQALVATLVLQVILESPMVTQEALALPERHPHLEADQADLMRLAV